MLLVLQKEDIENLIQGQRSAIKAYAIFAFGIVVFGVGLLIFANTVASTDVIKTIINIGGAFVSTLSGFPIKEIITRRDRINTYKILKRHLIVILEREDEISQSEKQSIIDMIMEILKKTALT